MRRKRLPFFLESSGTEEKPAFDALLALHVIAGRLASQIRAAEQKGNEAEVRRLVGDRRKLVNWLVFDRGADLDVATMQAMRDFGLSVQQIEDFRTFCQTHPRGRPVSQRHAAIAALKEQRRRPESTRADIAAEVCRCPRKVHGKDCVPDLWAEVRRLKRYLKAWGYRP